MTIKLLRHVLTAALSASLLLCAVPSTAQENNAGAKPSAGASLLATDIVSRAASAMGGIERLRAAKSITLNGYGQYAYMWGGGRIDGSATAPEKYIAANALVRVYDLEHGRFQAQERRNMLFPFLEPFGHSFLPIDQRLDGNVAYDVMAGQPARQARRTETPLWNDGVHMRRMWMMNNPAVLVRAMSENGAKLSAPRAENGLQVIDLTLAEGDKLSAGFRSDGLPAFVRWTDPHPNLGQVAFTTWLSGWGAWDGADGIRLPTGYTTRLDWRDVEYFKLYVDAYKVNAPIPDLAAPSSVSAAMEPPSNPVRALTSVPVGRGIWRINNGSTVVEFKDHLVLFELGVLPDEAKATLAYARDLGHGKPIRYLVASHNHFDHTLGLRQAVAEGITVIQRPSTLAQFQETVSRSAPDYPDDLARSPQPFKTRVMGDHLRLQDDTQTLDLYWGRNNGHMADVVFAYAPEQKVMMEGDLVTAAYQWQNWADTFRDVTTYYKLDVEKISPVHSVWKEHPDVLTRAQAEELLQGGVKRSRERCDSEGAKGNFIPGCPIQSKYY